MRKFRILWKKEDDHIRIDVAIVLAILVVVVLLLVPLVWGMVR